MRNRVYAAAAILQGLLAVCIGPAVNAAELTDDEVKAEIIRQGIGQYPGSCPCPFNFDRAGHQCGGRSAWSRAGGAKPLCFPEEVTAEMIRAWRVQNSSG